MSRSAETVARGGGVVERITRGRRVPIIGLLPVQSTLPLWLLGGLVALVALASSVHGAVDIPWQALPRLLFGSVPPDEALWQEVLWQVRLPRVLFSLLVGAALALCGAVMQALFRNPLADPGLVGISMGGAAGAVIAIVLLSGGLWLVAPAAFVGSLIAALAAWTLGRRYPGVAGILLAGIAINTMAGAIIGMMVFMADDAQLRDLTFWNLGSLAGGRWSWLAVLFPWVGLWSVWLLSRWRLLNALLLGEREALHLGFPIVAARRNLLWVVALIVGPLVAVTGGIAFVGLVVPHLVRMVLGANHHRLLPASVLLGALTLALADWLARTIVMPAELPIGLVTALLGGPFFLYLLARGK